MENAGDKVLGVVVCDLERSAIGTRSRLGDVFCDGRTVLEEVVGRMVRVRGLGEVAVIVLEGDLEGAEKIVALGTKDCPVRVHAGARRAAALDGRVRIGRAWGLLSWRGGAGQWTVFDEDYHPAAIGQAAAAAFGGTGADHVLSVHSHGVLLDPDLCGMLVDHHLHKNHQTPFSFTAAAPGLCGMCFSAEAVRKMAELEFLPSAWLAYDPKSPTFDTLIRDSCMQVDPALSKIPNRFCADTHRGWASCEEMAGRKWESVAEMCLAAARGVAPGVQDFSRVFDFPREVEIELTGRRLSEPPGSVPAAIRAGRGELAPEMWVRWFERQGNLAGGCDDLLLTVGGDGDPLLYGEAGGGLREILRAARGCGVLSINVETDLVGGDVEGLLAVIQEGLVDIVSERFYGHTADTYAKVGGGADTDLHAAVMRNMGRLAEMTRGRGGVPLVVPRLLKVRETIGEMEAFFDFWLERTGWAVIEGPTDRGGELPFAAVVDMAPPRRRPCRRLWDRMKIRADGRLAACDQDMHGKLVRGHIENMGIEELWRNLTELRNKHAAEQWGNLSPCATCREWHRP